jgi:hypothetical protein
VNNNELKYWSSLWVTASSKSSAMCNPSVSDCVTPSLGKNAVVTKDPAYDGRARP